MALIMKFSTLVTVAAMLASASADPTSSAPASTSGALSTIPTASGESYYTVQPSDNFWAIANSHGIDTVQLSSANPGVTPTLITSGQLIALPPPMTTPTSVLSTIPTASGGSYYTVQPSDDLNKIANSHGLELAQLENANPTITNPALITVGQVIALPSPATTPAAKVRARRLPRQP